MVLAQNSPSHYFALNMLVSGGVQPPEVDMILHGGRFRGRRGVQWAKRHLGVCVVGSGHLQPGEDQGQPHAGDHPGLPTG